jgi:flagellar motor switch protein FliG
MQNYSESGTLDYVLYIGGALLLAGLLIALFMRVLSVNREAKQMVKATPGGMEMPNQNISMMQPGAPVQNHMPVQNSQPMMHEKTSLKMQVEELKGDIIQVLMENTKVARETFGRMLKEEGVEDTAKYIKILGQMVIIELLDDPNLQRDLYSLSEFYHNSNFTFELSEEYELLQKLKTKITASEIRVLTRKSMDKFDFLAKLDSEQIFNLVADETAQVQSIVLTQLDRKRRLSVFNMYQGDSKMSLMNELCKADAIPKEYLSNVALALGRKVTSRPEFDTQNLRSSEVLVDLMERAELGEQKRLMSNLINTNPEAARGIKMRLVTLELLPYLKDGHLLEIILGMERADLLSFLKGTREHISSLLLQKAPPELADSWIEDLNYMANVDDASYRLAEMSILRRIRNLASNGSISIMEINEMIFADANRYPYSDQNEPLDNFNDGELVA